MNSIVGIWRKTDLIGIDVETTGLNAAVNRIVEIGVVRFRCGEVIDRWSTLINPGLTPENVDPNAFAVNGLSPEKLSDAPTFGDIDSTFYEKIEGGVPCAYRAEFEHTFICEEFRRLGVDVCDFFKDIVDPAVIAQHYFHRCHRLTQICEKLKIPHENPHRALPDAEAAGRVFYHFASHPRIRWALNKPLPTFFEQQKKWAEQNEAEFQKWLAKKHAKESAVAEPVLQGGGDPK